MATRRKILSQEEIAAAFQASSGACVPAILTAKDLALLIQISVKTLYEWCAKGRLDGAFRKRGKRLLFYRERALDILFNGKEWT